MHEEEVRVEISFEIITLKKPLFERLKQSNGSEILRVGLSRNPLRSVEFSIADTTDFGPSECLTVIRNGGKDTKTRCGNGLALELWALVRAIWPL